MEKTKTLKIFEIFMKLQIPKKNSKSKEFSRKFPVLGNFKKQTIYKEIEKMEKNKNFEAF